jgi:hypothetical protein
MRDYKRVILGMFLIDTTCLSKRAVAFLSITFERACSGTDLVKLRGDNCRTVFWFTLHHCYRLDEFRLKTDKLIVGFNVLLCALLVNRNGIANIK